MDTLIVGLPNPHQTSPPLQDEPRSVRLAGATVRATSEETGGGSSARLDSKRLAQLGTMVLDVRVVVG